MRRPKAYFSVSEQEYGGEIAKIKAMIDSGNTTIDVVDVDAPTLLQGCDEGIFEQIDWEKIGPKSEWLAGTTSDCGVGTIVYATILSFDEQKLANKPTKLADLFDLAILGKRARGRTRDHLNRAAGRWRAAGRSLQDAGDAGRARPRLRQARHDQEREIVWWEAGAQAP